MFLGVLNNRENYDMMQVFGQACLQKS